jgi:hypothetical protein
MSNQKFIEACKIAVAAVSSGKALDGLLDIYTTNRDKTVVRSVQRIVANRRKQLAGHGGAPVGNKNAAKPTEEKATAVVFLRLTAAQKEAVQSVAHKSNLTLTDWVRRQVLYNAGVEV